MPTVTKIDPPGEIRSLVVLDRVDYADTFRMDTAKARSRSPEQWLRDVLENGPLRRFLVLGWSLLGARLGPLRSADHLLGWKIDERDDDHIRLSVDWRLGLGANLVLRTSDSAVTLATFVKLRSVPSRVVWRLITRFHHWSLRLLLTDAARRPAPPLAVLWFQRHLANPISRRVARFLPGEAVLETVGRRSGLPRETPIGGRLEGATFWIVTEFGRQSQYVRNLEAQPRVRLQVKGRWHTGTASIVDDDDPRVRLRKLPWFNSLVVRTVGTNLLTVRVDLD
ncbi:nitroreductase/quinone reductase family protein [Amycolatopsis sp. NPDC058986]|uniref:nitroreductase/quinone reductase family protein n=1 Tax=unclassified Amycolatopsis TaxID=2618356 RepID=UPI00366B2677